MMPTKTNREEGNGMAKESVQSAKASRARVVQADKSKAGQKKVDSAAAKPAAKPRLASIGICCTLAWAFLINAAGGEAPTGQLSWQVSYFALAVAMVAFGFIARSKPAFVESPAAGYVAAVAGAFGAAALLLAGTIVRKLRRRRA